MGMRTELATLTVKRLTCGVVYRGPFAGMQYVTSSVGSTLAPKLLGCYERELAGAMQRIIADQPDLIIDIGAAEGYYAVGLARALPDAKIVAYEATESGRRLLAGMAKRNNAENIEIAGLCDVESLRNSLSDENACWLIIDIEGAEREMLDPAAAPELKKCRILVELHDHVHAGLGDLIVERFSPTHEIEEVCQEPRTADDFPFPIKGLLACLPRWIPNKAMDEKRPTSMRWLVMTPLT